MISEIIITATEQRANDTPETKRALSLSSGTLAEVEPQRQCSSKWLQHGMHRPNTLSQLVSDKLSRTTPPQADTP
jgi:hypothetical protein